MHIYLFTDREILPIKIRIIDGIPYIVDSTEKYHPYRGAQITKVNGIDCQFVLFEAVDGVIDTVILYPYVRLPWIAACSVDCKPDMYDTPMGQVCDYVYDESHKISMGPDGSMLYIWYD